MNKHETAAWRDLLALGARVTQVGGEAALDLSGCRARSDTEAARLVDAVIQVAGNSGDVTRHQDRHGRLVLVRHEIKAVSS